MKNLDTVYVILHSAVMRITLTLPDQLAKRFLVTVPSRERSATIVHLLEQELAQREQALEAACLAANIDTALVTETEEWQSFDDNLEDTNGQ